MSDLLERVRSGGLLEAGRPVVVLLSGGQDSVCLLDLAARLCGGAARALHANYALREGADGDEAHCRALCERLGVPLTVRPAPPRVGGGGSGNLQAWAREIRYAAAREAGTDVATGHTASDQAETVLYRLAASPGRRALLGMRERDGDVVRPLLTFTREQTAAHCRARDLTWREDPTNADPAFARNRARHAVLPALRSLHPAAEANLLKTLATLRDEAEVLDHLVDRILAGRTAIPAKELDGLPPALRRLTLTAMAHGAPVGHRVDELLTLARRGGTKQLHLGEGLVARTTYGEIEVEGEKDQSPSQELGLGPPGKGTVLLANGLEFGEGRVTLERGPALKPAEGVLDADKAGQLRVRSWRPGDRMRPLGLGGSKSLQDLFTDRKVPRAERGRLPVVLTQSGEIAWVPGVATAESVRVTPATRDRVRLRWRPPG